MVTDVHKKAVLWQGNRMYDAVVKFDTYRNLYSGVERFFVR